jgi:hypothetical protein
MKTFFVAALRLATALFFAGLALSLAVAVYYWGANMYKRNQAKPYEAIKEWQSDLRSNIGLQLLVKTKLVDDKMLLSVEVVGYPIYFSHPRLAERNRKAQLSIHFVDTDGFKVFSKPIQISEFSGIVGDKGEKIGLRTQTQDYISLDDYKRFQRLQIEWTLETKIPPDPPPGFKEDTEIPDHCAPNLSRAERIKRLSRNGELRETGSGIYVAGERSVHFFSDGGLLNCH